MICILLVGESNPKEVAKDNSNITVPLELIYFEHPYDPNQIPESVNDKGVRDKCIYFVRD